MKNRVKAIVLGCLIGVGALTGIANADQSKKHIAAKLNSTGYLTVPGQDKIFATAKFTWNSEISLSDLANKKTVGEMKLTRNRKLHNSYQLSIVRYKPSYLVVKADNKDSHPFYFVLNKDGKLYSSPFLTPDLQVRDDGFEFTERTWTIEYGEYSTETTFRGDVRPLILRIQNDEIKRTHRANFETFKIKLNALYNSFFKEDGEIEDHAKLNQMKNWVSNLIEESKSLQLADEDKLTESMAKIRFMEQAVDGHWSILNNHRTLVDEYVRYFKF